MSARILALVAICCAAVAVATAAGQQTFRAGVDAVAVDVSVREGSRVITGLAPTDFVVTDNGVRQTVTDVSIGKLPIDVSVVLDVSRSVSGSRLSELRRAIGEFMRDFTDADRLRLLVFNERVRRMVDFTSHPQEIDAALRETTGRGATSVLDALAVAMVTAEHPERRQLVVLFGDGADTTSVTSTQVLLDLAQHTNAAVSVVQPPTATIVTMFGGALDVVTRGAAVGQAEYLKFYRRLAAETGGVVTIQEPRQDLTATFRKALDEFRSSYVLRFSPTVTAPGFHTLEVSVPSRPKAALRARRGYWGS